MSPTNCVAMSVWLLKEQHEIKKNQPRLNHAMKYRHFPMGIRRDSSSPYHRLSIEQVRLDGVYLDVFKNKKKPKVVSAFG